MHGKAEFLHVDGADEPPRHVHPSLTTAIASASTISAVALPDRASAPPDELPLHRISSLPPPLGKPNHGQDLIFRTEARQELDAERRGRRRSDRRVRGWRRDVGRRVDREEGAAASGVGEGVVAGEGAETRGFQGKWGTTRRLIRQTADQTRNCSGGFSENCPRVNLFGKMVVPNY